MSPEFVIFDTLRRHGVPFVIVGGHAVNFHGFRRATEDSDLVWQRTDQSEPLLLAALVEMNASFIGKDIDPATGIERLYPVTFPYLKISRLMMLWTTHGFVDLFDYIPSFPDVPVEDLFASAVDEDGLRFPSLDWLRRMKSAAGRPKDLIDLDHLMG